MECQKKILKIQLKIFKNNTKWILELQADSNFAPTFVDHPVFFLVTLFTVGSFYP